MPYNDISIERLGKIFRVSKAIMRQKKHIDPTWEGARVRILIKEANVTEFVVYHPDKEGESVVIYM